MPFTLKHVLISDEIDDKCVNLLKSNNIQVTKNTSLTREQLLTEIKNYDGLIVRSSTKVTADVILAATNLKIIGRAGTGVDNIDVAAATLKGVIVMNTPGGNTISAAELTCSMLLAISRHISQGTASLRAGRWDRKKLMGNEVYGKTLAIVGLGRIGKEVALRMQAFGMTTIGYDPIIPAEEAATFNTQWLPLEEIWPQADYITVHTPLIKQTKHLLNDDVFAKCKEGVRVINVARGGIIDEDALLRALNSGKCAGAGLDVFVEEPATNAELIAHPNVTSSPHLGASTMEAQTRVAVEIAQQFIDVSEGRELFGAINAHALSNALAPETQPWVQLAKALGALGRKLTGTPDKLTQLAVNTYGPMLKQADTYMGAAALVGLMGTDQKETLNLISAPVKACNAGIQVTKNHVTESPSNMSLVTVEVNNDSTTHSVSGTVSGGQALLTAIDDDTFPQAVSLVGQMLVYRSKAESLGAIVGALTGCGISILSFNASSVRNGESWNVIQLSPALENGIELLREHTTFVGKVDFK